VLLCVDPRETNLCTGKFCIRSRLVQVCLEFVENAGKVLWQIELRSRLRMNPATEAEREEKCNC
jgi:hypothetical protein